MSSPTFTEFLCPSLSMSERGKLRPDATLFEFEVSASKPSIIRDDSLSQADVVCFGVSGR